VDAEDARMQSQVEARGSRWKRGRPKEAGKRLQRREKEGSHKKEDERSSVFVVGCCCVNMFNLHIEIKIKRKQAREKKKERNRWKYKQELEISYVGR